MCLGKKCNCLTKIRKAEGINVDKGVGTEPVLLRVGVCLAIPEEPARGQKTAQCPICRGDSSTAMTTNESAPRGSMRTCPKTVLSEQPTEGHSVPAALCTCLARPAQSRRPRGLGRGVLWHAAHRWMKEPWAMRARVTLCSWGKSEASVALFIRLVLS